MRHNTVLTLPPKCLATYLVLVSAAACFAVANAARSGHTGSAPWPSTTSAGPVSFEGRWLYDPKDATWRADWPCSTLSFRMRVQPSGAAPDITLTLKLNILRSRVLVTVSKVPISHTEPAARVVHSEVLRGNSWLDEPETYQVVFPAAPGGQEALYEVTARKLTTAAPFGMGAASHFLAGSVFRYYSASLDRGELLPAPPPPATDKRIEFVGASDTAGYCVDGEPSFHFYDYAFPNGWKYENCDSSYPGQLQRLLTEDSSDGPKLGRSVLGDGEDGDDDIRVQIHVEAASGMGLVQNAESDQVWQLGKRTMFGYFDFALQTGGEGEANAWEFGTWEPDLVVVSLGGNDYNHQANGGPSQINFSTTYKEFLSEKVFGRYQASEPKVLLVCGGGPPNPADGNDRCHPCPHVEQAYHDFLNDSAGGGVGERLFYKFVPCNGTVVTGKDDIGCNGHRNRLGQSRVAMYLRDTVKELLGLASTSKAEHFSGAASTRSTEDRRSHENTY